MEDELWSRLCAAITEMASGFRTKKVHHSDAWIVQVYLYSILRDRPVSWACDKRNWPGGFAHRNFPSPSCMSRRLPTEGVVRLLDRLERHVGAPLGRHPLLKWIDAMPLAVGGSTTDRHARFGRAAGCMAKGYKFFAIVDPHAVAVSWRVGPMNCSEKRMARRLIRDLDGQGYLVGDAEYDSNHLYRRSGMQGYQLLAAKRQGELSHRRHCPQRLRGIELQQRPFGRQLLADRAGIDRFFGQWSTHACGLKRLPNWVRGLPRVRRYVQAKLLWHYLWLRQKQELTA
jgi:hypothetical protein